MKKKCNNDILYISLLTCSLLFSCSESNASNEIIKSENSITEVKPDAMQKKYPLLMGNNPCITTMFTADPTARVFDGVLYLFPSTDIPDPGNMANNGFCMPGYNVFSTENFFDWKDYGQVINQKDVKWATQEKYCMWAPDCIKKGNTFYYYFPTKTSDNKTFKVGYATSSNPGGPYKVSEKVINGANGIDPNVFIDDDGQAYMYWGGGKILKGSKLKSNMTELEGKTVDIQNIPEEYKEASFLFKRKGIYYFTFSHDIGGKCELSYATSKNPLGPFEYKGRFLAPWNNCWTIHHSIVEYKGKWILFYHHNDMSNVKQNDRYTDKLRSVMADYITFADNGDINEVTPTYRGIGDNPASRTIQIDRYSEIDDSKLKIQKENDNLPGNWIVNYIKDGAWLKYDRVDFMKKKFKKIQIRYQSEKSGGIIEVYENNENGKLIATVNIPANNNWRKWEIIEDNIKYNPKGVSNLYFKFKGTGPYLYNIDWVKFIE